MLNVFHSLSKSGIREVTMAHSFNNDTADYLDAKIWKELVNKIAEEWMKEYRVEVFKAIDSKKVAQAVKKQIEDKFAERFLS